MVWRNSPRRTAGPSTERSGSAVLSQPFSVAEQFTGNKGKYVPLEDTIRSFEVILGGEVDSPPETAFYMAGSIDDVFARSKDPSA